MPLGQQPDLFGLGGNYLIVRAAGGQSPAAAVARAARAASSAAPSTPVAWAHTFEDEFRSTIMAQRLGLLLFRLFAALALLLTGLGLFAVFAFAVTQRTREIGIRVALGSSRASVVALVARQAAAPLLSGLVAGGTLLFLAAPALERFLFAAPAAAPDRVVLLILTIVALAAAATWIPTRRALAIEPVTALRE
jgi:putative ABC transport system permease protein